MKKYFKYIILFLVVVCLYKVADKILDKLYLSRYTISDYTDDTRFTTVNKVINKRFKKSDVAILVNTEYIDQVVSIAPYSYVENLPVFYTEKQKVLKPVYDQMEKLGVKKVILAGGVNSLSESIERSLDRNGYKVERIVEPRGINFSIKMAELISNKHDISQIAIVTNDEFDLPNAISFSPYAQENNIPIMVTTNNNDDFVKINSFISKHNVKKVYIVGNNGNINSNLLNTYKGEIVKIIGEDRYDLNTKIIGKLYNDRKNDSIYISKGGELLHKRHIGTGQLINAMAISPLAADNKAPLLLIKNNYFETDETDIIEKRGYTHLNQVGFKIERRNYFNVERFKDFTTAVIIIISILMSLRLIFDKKINDYRKTNI